MSSSNLQEKFIELWQPIKDKILFNINELNYSVNGIPNHEIKEKILEYVNKIKDLVEKREAFPYLYLDNIEPRHTL
jgi:hypothetical protein